MSKENINQNILNYLNIDYPEQISITDETKELTKKAAVSGLSSGSVRIDLGLFYTDKEYEKMSETVLKRPLP